MSRYALYFAPDPEVPLWQFGSAVIGYDAATGSLLACPSSLEVPHDAWSALTEEPRRYGFHATLKAPFELAANIDEARLLAEVERHAAGLAPVTLSGLEIAALGRFIALVPRQPSAELQALADRIATGLDYVRAPLGEADRARRLRSPLTPRQIEYLDRYGYPYVREEFRFHMTLTGPIAEPAELRRMTERLRSAYLAAVPAGSTVIDQVAVFRQDGRDARFRIIGRFPLSGRPAA